MQPAKKAFIILANGKQHLDVPQFIISATPAPTLIRVKVSSTILHRLAQPK